MRTIWIDDYIVVMACVNQYCLDTFACLEYDVNLLKLINLFKAFACLVVIFWSSWISLVERSHSNFALAVFCVQTEEGWAPYWDP
jgi:hypothetical protein